MTHLASMTEAEFQTYACHARNNFQTDDNPGAWPDQATAERQFDATFPQGIKTPDLEFFSIRDEAGESVGSLIVRTLSRSTGREAFVMDLVIWKDHRRRGHASRALTSLEKWAAHNGCDTVSLAVLNSNTIALSLYQRLGFTPLFTRLTKATRRTS